MALNWINVEEYSFNSLLLLERFQIRLLCSMCGSDNTERRQHLGIALHSNPAVAWYLQHRCPECAEYVEQLIADTTNDGNEETVRNSECAVMGMIEDFILYTTPERMDTSCSFIYGWERSRLFELADFKDKVVLDVGAGSGRLAFAAAEQAGEVYASEPVERLREYLRDTIIQKGISNIRVVDGMAHSLPYPDDTFDIVMSGHVVGDDFDNEIAELTRVVKNGGFLIDCPGEDPDLPTEELRKRGWDEFVYESKFGGYVYRYRKQIVK